MRDKIPRKPPTLDFRVEQTDAVAMVGTMISTENYVASFINTTTILATTAALAFDYNATEFWNASGDGDEANRTYLFHPCDPANKEFNCTEDEFLNFHLGAKQMPLETAVWVSLLIRIPRNPLISPNNIAEIFASKTSPLSCPVSL